MTRPRRTAAERNRSVEGKRPGMPPMLAGHQAAVYARCDTAAVAVDLTPEAAGR